MPSNAESTALLQALDEPLTTFLVFGSHPQVDPDALRATHDRAILVAQLTPDRWRTFLVQSPDSLDDDLKDLIWPGGDTSPAVLLGIGEGLERARVEIFQLSDLARSLHIARAFTKGTSGI